MNDDEIKKAIKENSYESLMKKYERVSITIYEHSIKMTFMIWTPIYIAVILGRTTGFWFWGWDETILFYAFFIGGTSLATFLLLTIPRVYIIYRKMIFEDDNDGSGGSTPTYSPERKPRKKNVFDIGLSSRRESNSE